MSARQAPSATLERRPDMTSKQLERELLGRLGLSIDANTQDLERAHDEVIDFLELAPHELRGWADRQVALADEAYVLLSDPTRSLAGVTIETQPSLAPAHGQVGHEPLGRSTGPALPAPVGQRGGRSQVQRVLIATAGVVAVLTVVFAVYATGAPAVPGVTGTPVPESSGAAQIDTAQIGALMQNIEADPTDVASLQALADVYFQASDYATAAEWETKVLALEPKNITALLGLGAATFNQGNAVEAEKHWLTVLDLDPLNLEAHYDLGFMYFSQNPPDIERTTAEWNSVIEISPDSDIARTVATHLATLQSWAASSAPSGSSPASSPADASPSPDPSAGGTPAPSPAVP
jgi:tetratricopeptide (TPR) repeat protein